ncbi:MAG: PilN domain-containing protein, partial [Armatimonadota bacterium]
YHDVHPLLLPGGKLLFVSDVALADEFYEKVAAATGVPARASAPLAGVPAGDEGGQAAATDGATFAPALGAALRAAEASEAFCIPLSIVRDERRKIDLGALVKILAPGVVILACFLLAAALTWSAARTESYEEQRVKGLIAKELAGIEAGSGGLTAEEKSHLLDSIEANKSLAAGGRAIHAPDVIAALVAALPVGTSVEKLTIDKDGDISVKGTTRTEADAVALQRSFEAADAITLARLSSLRAAGAGDEAYVEFDIVASAR